MSQASCCKTLWQKNKEKCLWSDTHKYILPTLEMANGNGSEFLFGDKISRSV